MDMRYPIDDKGIHFVKGDGYTLIGNPDYPYGTSTHHEYFCIHDDLCGIILENEQNYDITLKAVHKELSFSSINDNTSGSISEKNSRSEMVSTRHLFMILIWRIDISLMIKAFTL